MFSEKEFVRRFHKEEQRALKAILEERGHPGEIIEVVQIGEWVAAIFCLDEGRFYPVVCDFGGREVGEGRVEMVKFAVFSEGDWQLEAYVDSGHKIIKARDSDGLVVWSVKVKEPAREVWLWRNLVSWSGQGQIVYQWGETTPPQLVVGKEHRGEILHGVYEILGKKAILNKHLSGKSPYLRRDWKFSSEVAKNLFNPRCRNFENYPFWVEGVVVK